MWYYKQTETNLWTVMCGEGHTRTTDSDHDSQEDAAKRAAFLNGGGKGNGDQSELMQRIAVTMERQAVAMERQAEAAEKLAGLIENGWLRVDIADKSF